MYNIMFKRLNEELALIGKENTNHGRKYRGFLEDSCTRFEKFIFQIVIHFHPSHSLQKTLLNGCSTQIY